MATTFLSRDHMIPLALQSDARRRGIKSWTRHFRNPQEAAAYAALPGSREVLALHSQVTAVYDGCGECAGLRWYTDPKDVQLGFSIHIAHSRREAIQIEDKIHRDVRKCDCPR